MRSIKIRTALYFPIVLIRVGVEQFVAIRATHYLLFRLCGEGTLYLFCAKPFL